MKDNYAEVLESYLIPAEEGLGIDLLKLAGTGVLKIAKKIAIFLGINLAIVGTLVAVSNVQQKEAKRRFDNPTPEEKQSRNNYTNTWKPEIIKFSEMIKNDIEEADKKLDIKKFIEIYNTNNFNSNIKINGMSPIYNTYLCGLEWSKCQYPGAAGDDEGDPKLVKEFSEKISKMKPYFDKWKREAKKFEPYFVLDLEVEEADPDYYFCNFYVTLRCKWVDKQGILKPGLPEFKKIK